MHATHYGGSSATADLPGRSSMIRLGFSAVGESFGARSRSSTTFDRPVPRSGQKIWAGSFPAARAVGPRFPRRRVDPEEYEVRLVADVRLPGSKDQAGGRRAGQGREHAGELALPEDFAGRLVQGDESPRGSSPGGDRPAVDHALQAEDAAPPAALARLQGEAIDHATSRLLDEEPPVGFDRRLAMLLRRRRGRLRRAKSFPDGARDPPLQVGTDHASRQRARRGRIAGPGCLAFAGQLLALGGLQDLLPGKHVAGLGMQLHEAQRRDELAGGPDREHEEPPAIPERIAGRRAAAIAQPQLAARLGRRGRPLRSGRRPGRRGRRFVARRPAAARGRATSRCPRRTSQRTFPAGRSKAVIRGARRRSASLRRPAGQLPPGPIDAWGIPRASIRHSSPLKPRPAASLSWPKEAAW